MPELPDIYVLARSMNKALNGRKITDAVVNQHKCLNTTPHTFRRRVRGRTIMSSTQRGKWVLTNLDEKWTVAFNLGMGGEIRLFDEKTKPDNRYHRVVINLEKGDWIGIHHWWFGHVHLIPKDDLMAHPQLSKLGPEPLKKEFTIERLAEMVRKKRGRIKAYLLNQSFIAGIGNVYVQDILWYAGIHPNRPAGSLDTNEISHLHHAIQYVLKEGIRYGGGPQEQDLFGNMGTYMEHRAIGYREGEQCPRCSTTIEKIRTGQTASYICPKCQV